jgi:hypothetical protein
MDTYDEFRVTKDSRMFRNKFPQNYENIHPSNKLKSLRKATKGQTPKGIIKLLNNKIRKNDNDITNNICIARSNFNQAYKRLYHISLTECKYCKDYNNTANENPTHNTNFKPGFWGENLRGWHKQHYKLYQSYRWSDDIVH